MPVSIPIDDISTQYITLAFALEQHAEGFVDAYFGPPALRPGGSPRPLQSIATDVEALRQQVQQSDYPLRRKEFLAIQLRAMAALARKLAGEPLTYRDEVRLLFDIEPYHTPEIVFEETIAALNEVLPGTGTLAERMAAWKRRYEVTPSVAHQMIDRIATEARSRTLAFVSLPANEVVEFTLVNNKPWSGYNWYLGGGRSRVEINIDLPIRASSLLDLVCHEAYPGHHTEHMLKERVLYVERGWGEHAIQLINTPQSVISEGIATLAADMIFGDEAASWAAQEVYPLGNIAAQSEQEQRISAANRVLRALSANAALLLHEQGADAEEVVQYIMRYGLRSEQEARQQLRFIHTPLWRAYTFTYHVGRDLLQRWFARGNRLTRFHQMLTDQIYPSLVEQWVLEEERSCVSN